MLVVELGVNQPHSAIFDGASVGRKWATPSAITARIAAADRPRFVAIFRPKQQEQQKGGRAPSETGGGLRRYERPCAPALRARVCYNIYGLSGGSAGVRAHEWARFVRGLPLGSARAIPVRSGGVAVLVTITSRALDLLAFLIQHTGELVSKDAIMKAVWPGNGRRGRQPHRPDFGVAPHFRSEPKPTQLYPDDTPARLPLCRVGDAARSRYVMRDFGDTRKGRAAAVAPVDRCADLANLSDNRDQQYLVDGITDDLTTDLSRIPGVFVISRNTAFLSEQTGRRRADRPRAVRELCAGRECASIGHSCARQRPAHRRRDRRAFVGGAVDIGDLFALQNEVTSRIAVALNLELIDAAAARSTEHPDAHDYIFADEPIMRSCRRVRAMPRVSASMREHWRSHPGSVEAQSLLATMLTSRA
jgi:TolB-like protein